MDNKPLSRFCECFVCGTEKLANRALLPDGWLTLWGFPYTLCDTCTERWKERFNEEPAYWVKGAEKELMLL